MLGADATLSALTVSPRDIIGFAADETYYAVGVASSVTTATINATPNHSGARVAITPADASSAAGHQVSLSPPGSNMVTITVTAEDTTIRLKDTTSSSTGASPPPTAGRRKMTWTASGRQETRPHGPSGATQQKSGRWTQMTLLSTRTTARAHDKPARNST